MKKITNIKQNIRFIIATVSAISLVINKQDGNKISCNII